MLLIVAILVGLLPMVPAVIYFVRNQKNEPAKATRSLIFGLNGFNLLVGVIIAAFGFIWLASPSTVSASGLVGAAASSSPYDTLAAALSTGLACIGAGIAVANTGAAAIGAIAEKPESFGRSLIFVGMAEGVAIYGLIIAFMVLNR